jgi:hypothetical protein
MMFAGQQPQQQPKAGVDGEAFNNAQAKALNEKSLAEKSGSDASGMMKARFESDSAGMKAGAMNAGLQPHPSKGTLPLNSATTAMLDGTQSMKEWVFDGVEGNPNLRSLFEAQKGGSAKAGENLLKKIQTEPQQVRGELAKEIAGTNQMPTLSDLTMASAQQHALSNGEAMSGISAQAGAIHGHAIIDRSAPQGAHSNGSSALSGGEFLSTLSALRGGAQNAASQGGNGAGAFGREGGKAGFKFGSNVGELKKHRLESGEDSDFNSLTAGASTAGLSGSAMLNGAKADVAAKAAGGQTSMRADVTTGSMAQDRIASSSVQAMSTNIRSMASNGQGGEMRIRLNPDNLGEIQLRVVTDGRQVGLHVQASDEKAKKILEQSLSDLKDSLSKHQLSLAHVDFAVAHPQGAFSSDMGTDSRQNPSHQSFGGMHDMMNNGHGEQRSNSWAGTQEGNRARESWNGGSLRTAMPGRAAARVASVGPKEIGGVASRRLDIRA